MENLLTNKMVSITELREPNKVVAKAGKQPVAVMNRSNVVGYFVPASAVEPLDHRDVSQEDLMTALNSLDADTLQTNKYLKDK